MRQRGNSDQVTGAFRSSGREFMATVEQLLAKIPRGDTSGWYYVESVAADAADGRKRATVKRMNTAVSASNPAIGPLICLRGYTPVVGHRVLVRWIAGDQADGVIEG